ncbi:hypothetical protein B0H16DRAFT_352776 [Mycena metata]|uniref:Uncharacterized protein n=1 Tax=Mycena metata TaxID=1033252 RepID=A0AAD7JLP4_9AGAR|nr:hypothetical protein B0H16DRAFT_352776 [Mycena metata]
MRSTRSPWSPSCPTLSLLSPVPRVTSVQYPAAWSLRLPRTTNTTRAPTDPRHSSGRDLPLRTPSLSPPHARRPSSAPSRSHHLTRAPAPIPRMPYTTTGVPSRAESDDRLPSHTPPSSFSARPHHLQRSTTFDAQCAYLAVALIRPDYHQLTQYLQQPFSIAHAAFVASSTPASSRTPLDRRYRT